MPRKQLSETEKARTMYSEIIEQNPELSALIEALIAQVSEKQPELRSFDVLTCLRDYMQFLVVQHREKANQDLVDKIWQTSEKLRAQSELAPSD